MCITYSCLSNSTCGCSLNPAVLMKIIGGEEARTDTWGWAVSIRVQNTHMCGGSLISSELILSAAHCFDAVRTISNLRVIAGSKYLSIINQQRSISEVYIHRNFDLHTYANDIAIIRVSPPFNMNDRSLALICPPPNTTEYPSTGTTVVAVGWGVLSTTDKAPSNTLQQVTLRTIASTAGSCQRLINYNDRQFCAGIQGGGKDTCQGDSGGPLMLFSNKKWYLAGITSYGKDCALSDYAGVYTRVSYYEKWIPCFVKNDTICIEKMFMIEEAMYKM